MGLGAAVFGKDRNKQAGTRFMGDEPKPARQNFDGLDGLRGMAAFIVFLYHGEQSGVFAARPEGAYLAVDLFFVISGFVIAFAYEPRFKAGLDPWTFFKQRWVRFYPLYILGALLGLIYFFGYHYQNQIALTPASALVVAPQFLMSPSGPNLLYSLNAPAWSLFAELCVNVVYALIWRRLTPLVFAILFVGSAILMAAAAIAANQLDVGWMWPNAIGGFARACFGFFAGVLLYRLHVRGALAPRIPTWVLFLLVAVLLSAPVPDAARPYVDLAIAFVASPLLVFFAVRVTSHGVERTISQALGRSSYALYAIHAPALALTAGAAALINPQLLSSAPLVTYAVVTAAFIGAALILERFYDGPARRWLTRKLLRRR